MANATISTETTTNPSATSATTIAQTLTVAPGQTIYVLATWDDAGTPITASCADNVNGTYGAALTGGPARSSGDQQSMSHWQFTNANKTGANASITVTVTFSVTTPFRGLRCCQGSNMRLVSAFDAANGQNQAAPATGSATCTSTNITPTRQPFLLVGGCGDMHNANQPTANTGGGFTSGVTGWSASFITEWQRFTSLSAVAATFTPTVAEDHITLAAIFTEQGVWYDDQPPITPPPPPPRRLSIPLMLMQMSPAGAPLTPLAPWYQAELPPAAVPVARLSTKKALAEEPWIFPPPAPPPPLALGLADPAPPCPPPPPFRAKRAAVVGDGFLPSPAISLRAEGWTPITPRPLLPKLPTESMAPQPWSQSPLTGRAAWFEAKPPVYRRPLPPPNRPPQDPWILSRVIPTYRFSVHSSGRYFLKNGIRFLMIGDSSFQAINHLSTTDAATYFDTCIRQGFNTVFLELLAQNGGDPQTPKSFLNDLPFTRNNSGTTYVGTQGTADFSTPNDPYFAYAKLIVDMAEARGLFVMLYTLPWGFDGNDGWWTDLTNSANTTGVCTNFGAYIAVGSGGTFSGFSQNQNIMWVEGSDYGDSSSGTPPSAAGQNRHLSITSGRKSAGALQLITGDWNAPSMSTDEAIFETSIQANGAYTYGGSFPDAGTPTNEQTYVQARAGWNYVPSATSQSQSGIVPSALPTYLKETAYEHSLVIGGISNADVRKTMWWAYLSGCIAGVIYGNENVWPFAAGAWPTALTDPGRSDMGRMSAFLQGLTPWWLLIPSELSSMRRLVPSANGTQTVGASYVASACSSDGSLLVGYFPNTNGTSAQTATFDLRSMAGPSRVRLWDPTTGTFTNLTSGAFTAANSNTAFSVSTPGANAGIGASAGNDFVVVFDTQTTLDVLGWLDQSPPFLQPRQGYRQRLDTTPWFLPPLVFSLTPALLEQQLARAQQPPPAPRALDDALSLRSGATPLVEAQSPRPLAPPAPRIPDEPPGSRITSALTSPLGDGPPQLPPRQTFGRPQGEGPWYLTPAVTAQTPSGWNVLLPRVPPQARPPRELTPWSLTAFATEVLEAQLPPRVPFILARKPPNEDVLPPLAAGPALPVDLLEPALIRRLFAIKTVLDDALPISNPPRALPDPTPRPPARTPPVRAPDTWFLPSLPSLFFSSFEASTPSSARSRPHQDLDTWLQTPLTAFRTFVPEWWPPPTRQRSPTRRATTTSRRCRSSRASRSPRARWAGPRTPRSRGDPWTTISRSPKAIPSRRSSTSSATPTARSPTSRQRRCSSASAERMRRLAAASLCRRW